MSNPPAIDWEKFREKYGSPILRTGSVTFYRNDELNKSPLRFCVIRNVSGALGHRSKIVTFDNDGAGYTYSEAQDRLQYELDVFVDKWGCSEHTYRRFNTYAQAQNWNVASEDERARLELFIIPMGIEESDRYD